MIGGSNSGFDIYYGPVNISTEKLSQIILANHSLPFTNVLPPTLHSLAIEGQGC